MIEQIKVVKVTTNDSRVWSPSRLGAFQADGEPLKERRHDDGEERNEGGRHEHMQEGSCDRIKRLKQIEVLSILNHYPFALFMGRGVVGR